MNAKTRYVNSVHVNDDCKHKLCLKIAAKRFPIKTLLLLLAVIGHRSSQRHHRRPFTTYGLATIHALQTTDDDKETTDVSKAQYKVLVLGTKKSFFISGVTTEHQRRYHIHSCP